MRRHFHFPFAFRKVLPTVLAPFKLVIIKVYDLPDQDPHFGDVQVKKNSTKPEPYVRIRFTEIENGKVFLYIWLACCVLGLTTHQHIITRPGIKIYGAHRS